MGESKATDRTPIRSSLIRGATLARLLEGARVCPVLTSPRAGDVVMCEAIGTSGTYPEIETAPCGTLEPLEDGACFLGVLGRRESGTNLCGRLPRGRLDESSILHLLAIAGLVGVAEHVPPHLGGIARPLRFRGALHDDAGERVNVRHSPPLRCADPCAPGKLRWFVVCGASAEVGKTTLVERLLARIPPGARVAGVKLSGTGRMKDKLRYRTAGASWVGDFADAGLETTYAASEELLDLMLQRLALGAVEEGLAIVIAELGGDLLEGGVPHLVRRLRTWDAKFLFVARDAMGAAKGLELLGGAALVVSSGANARALERRLGVEPVFDLDEPSSLEALATRLRLHCRSRRRGGR